MDWSEFNFVWMSELEIPCQIYRGEQVKYGKNSIYPVWPLVTSRQIWIYTVNMCFFIDKWISPCYVAARGVLDKSTQYKDVEYVTKNTYVVYKYGDVITSAVGCIEHRSM